MVQIRNIYIIPVKELRAINGRPSVDLCDHHFPTEIR